MPAERRRALTAALLVLAVAGDAHAQRPPASAAKVTLATGTTARPVRGGGALLRWHTRAERATVGFDVFLARRGAKRRVRLTRYPVAGAVVDVQASTVVRRRTGYRWYAKRARRGDRLFVRDIEVSGRTRTHGPFVVRGRPVRQAPSSPTLTSRPRPSATTPPATAGANGPPVPAATPSPTIAPVTPPAEVEPILAGRQTVRVSVTQDGWARVKLADLANRGVDVSVPANLHLFTGGREVAALVRDGGLEFYGRAIDTIDTGTRTYVVDAETGPGLRVHAATGAASAPAGPSTFAAQAIHEERFLYVSSLRNGEASNFFGAVVGGSGTDQLLGVPALQDAGPTLTVRLQGITDGAHEVAVSVNGTPVGTVGFADQASGAGTFAAPSLAAGPNTVRLVSSAPGDVSALARLTVEYRRRLTAENDVLALSVPGGRRLQVDGFSTPGLRAMDVTDPAAPTALPVDPNDGGGAFTSPEGEKRALLAFAPGAVAPVAAVAANPPTTLRSAANGGTLTIVTRSAYATALDPLVQRRRAEGLSVAVVDLQDVYDEFSQGQTDHHAVTAFLDYARAHWAVPPRYVLLGGDGTFDPRGYVGRGTAGDVVPIQPFDTALGEAASDSLLTGTLATGRLPARTTAQMAQMVAKTLAFSDRPQSRRAALVSDVSDNSDFRGDSLALEPLLPASWAVQQVDRGSDPDARSHLLSALGGGPSLVNYLGHGSVDLWRGNLLKAADAADLANTGAPSLYVLMTCLNGYFTDATLASLGEALLYASGGAAAVFSSTGQTSPGGQNEANRQLIASLYGSDAPVRVGDAIVDALNATSDQDVRSTWALLGDPTLPVGR